MNLAFAATMIRLSHAPDSIVAQKDSTAAFSHSREKSAIPEEPEHWSVTTLREKLVKIGAKVVRGRLSRSNLPRAACVAQCPEIHWQTRADGIAERGPARSDPHS